MHSPVMIQDFAPKNPVQLTLGCVAGQIVNGFYVISLNLILLGLFSMVLFEKGYHET